MKHFTQNSYEMMQAGLDCSDCMICPPKLYLDITQDCNLWCRMCRGSEGRPGKTMPVDLFRRLVDETSPYVRSYSLFNWGEPLMLNDFRERVRYVNRRKRPDCIVDISTNGMLLDADMSAFLAAEDIVTAISFDGDDKATFEQIRRGADFEKILKNAETSAKIYSRIPAQRSPSFYVSIQNANQNRLSAIAKLASSVGIRRIGFGLVTSPRRFAPEQGESLCRELERAYAFVREHEMFLEVYPTKIGKFVYADGAYRDGGNYIVSELCSAPLISAAVDYSGDVYLCCNVGERVGNISDGSLLTLWRSEQYRTLRNAVNSKADMPERCTGCAWFNRNR